MACTSRSVIKIIIIILLAGRFSPARARVACSVRQVQKIIRRACRRCGPNKCACNNRQMGMRRRYDTRPAFFWGYQDANPYFYSNAHFPYWGYDSQQPNGWLTPGWWVW